MYWKDHTFIICAYGESPYLEECIQSLFAQKTRSNLCIATSTPNQHIQRLAEKYRLQLYVNAEGGGIGADWNFAYAMGKTPYRTIAHQDDVYFPEYAQRIFQAARQAQKPLIFFTNYWELREKSYVKRNTLLRIKRMLLLPLCRRRLQSCVWVKRRILSLGNPICCPSVTFACENLPDAVFAPGFRASLDWEAWERLSRRRGEFVYVSRPLMAHRIHRESETSAAIQDQARRREDQAMYEKFWPSWMVKWLLRAYAASEKSNDSFHAPTGQAQHPK